MRSTATWVSLWALLIMEPFVASTPIDLQRYSPASLSHLSKRDVDRIICGNYATASGKGSGSYITQLDTLNRTGGDAVVSPKSCGRASCWDTSGIYVCNDQDVELRVPMADVVRVANIMVGYCAWNGGWSYDSISGQVYTDINGGFNVGIGYANCNHPSDERPETYEPPGGNGDPTIKCGDDANSPCLTPGGESSCDASRLTISSTESVTCGPYRGPGYVAAGTTYTYSISKSIGTTWDVGGFLGLNFGQLGKAMGQAALTFSFAETVTTGENFGGNGLCGKEDGDKTATPAYNFTCGMDVAPKCVRVSGTCNHPNPVIGEVAFVAQVPQTNPGTTQSVYTANVCTCKNCPGWAEDHAPVRTCTNDCLTCYPAPT